MSINRVKGCSIKASNCVYQKMGTDYGGLGIAHVSKIV